LKPSPFSKDNAHWLIKRVFPKKQYFEQPFEKRVNPQDGTLLEVDQQTSTNKGDSSEII